MRPSAAVRAKVLNYLRQQGVNGQMLTNAENHLKKNTIAQLERATIRPTLRIDWADPDPRGRLTLADLVRNAEAGTLGDL